MVLGVSTMSQMLQAEDISTLCGILWSLALVGRMAQRRIREKETRSGSSPRCLARVHVLVQSVFGYSSSHFRGTIGQLAQRGGQRYLGFVPLV